MNCLVLSSPIPQVLDDCVSLDVKHDRLVTGKVLSSVHLFIPLCQLRILCPPALLGTSKVKMSHSTSDSNIGNCVRLAITNQILAALGLFTISLIARSPPSIFLSCRSIHSLLCFPCLLTVSKNFKTKAFMTPSLRTWICLALRSISTSPVSSRGLLSANFCMRYSCM